MVGILVKSSLPSVPFLHPLFDAGQHFIIAQLHPWLADEETWWHLASKTFDDDVRVEPFGKVNDEVDILLKVEEITSGYFSVSLPSEPGMYIVYVYYDGQTYQRRIIVR